MPHTLTDKERAEVFDNEVDTEKRLWLALVWINELRSRVAELEAGFEEIVTDQPS